MTRFLLKSSISRPVSFTLLLIFVSEIIFPTAAMALTSGPSQPEVQSFEAISTSDMVDVFSGDFKYNIPLMDVEGYPLNIAYNAGIATDQEASWVGLGWNLNVGNVNRAMRGIPDDFKGDLIKKETYLKPNRSFGINAGVDFELFGKGSKKASNSAKGGKFKLKPSVGVGINFNNYTGFGVDLSVGVGISAGIGGKGKLDAGLGLHSNGASGLDITPNVSYSDQVSKTDERDKSLTHVNSGSGSLRGTFNSRAGVKEISFSGGYNKKVEKTTTNKEFNPMSMFHKNQPMFRTVTRVSTISSKGRSAGGSVNFGLQSYVPSISMPMINNSVALSVKFGTHLFGSDANVTLGGFYASQKLAETAKEAPAYGYMYAELGSSDPEAMMDFNREKDASFSRTTKNLPITNFTYDVYNVTAQGMGGTFRPFRSDVGHVSDAAEQSTSDSYSLGAELDGGNLIKGGITASIVDVVNSSGKWQNDNEALDYFRFGQPAVGSVYEPYYFKQVGEMSFNPSSESLYQNLGEDDAYGILVQQGFSNSAAGNSNLPNIKSKKKLEAAPYSSTSLSLSGNNKITTRQKRNQLFTTLSKSDAANFGLQKNLYNATGVRDAKNMAGTEMKIMSNSPAHHIAEISVIGNEGSRYYYGLPAYNIKTKEFSFNISGATMDGNGLVSYNSSDASASNSRGIDSHYNLTETPAYAYSYLLTAIVSADYMDQNNNGPDDADIGTYTKFHYKKSTAGNQDYKWRMPVDATSGKANFNENSKSNDQDNSGNVTYGEKELWYLDEIETKNYIARFILSDRKDGFGVSDEAGSIAYNTTPSKKIDRIELYSKPEYMAGGTPVPIKTVHFVYNYDLCTISGSKLPNNSGAAAGGNELSNGGGKLTLKQVYFTYGKSSRAVLNKFQFTYASNPFYHPKAYDRWGNYKPSGAVNYVYNQPATNAEISYVEQNKTNADLYAAAWNLTRINLPSGGEINIDYEADDYAFVQNMPAGQMFKVLGTTPAGSPPTWSTPVTNELYDANSGPARNYLVLDIQNPSLNITTHADFIKYYLKDISENNKQLFFRFLVNLTSPNAQNFPDFYEYVAGYADVVMANGRGSGGLILDANGNPTGRAWIELKNVSLKNKGNGPNTNPIAMSAIQFARINYGSAVWGTPFTPPEDIEEALKQLAQAAATSLKTLVTGFKNPNKALFDKDYCRRFEPSKSMVRLYNPNGKKLGGGSRVRSLSIDDKWSTMTAVNPNPGQASSIYGQNYKYETPDENGRMISSGVASYEPFIGGEENSMKQPSYMGKNKWAVLAPDDRYYVEGPFGESFYPSANVGYSKITVSSILPANAAQSSRNGYKVYEFYTAKDYPTITRHTPIMPKQFRSPLKSVVKICSRDLITASQGYVIMTNDMHGKPKAEYDYAEGKPEAEKETHFYYKSKNGYQPSSQVGLYSDASYSGNQLDNSCQVITKSGAVVTANLFGSDFDAIADFRQSETKTNYIASQGNVSSFLAGLFPAIVPSVWPETQFEQSRFRSSVFTKVVNQYGILEKTTVRVDGATTASESLAFDAETGNTLVTKTTNNFDDPIYTVKYPAYWGYDLMGGAYKNVGLYFSGSSLGNGLYNIGNYSALLNVGDELALNYGGGSTARAWICSKPSGSTIGLIDENGNPTAVPNPNKITVLRSARRNLYVNEMAALTCLKNPIVSNALTINAASRVLDAGGTEYSDQWQINRGYATYNPVCTTIVTQVGLDLINNQKTLLNNYCNTATNNFGPFGTGAHVNGYSTNYPVLSSAFPSYPNIMYSLLVKDPIVPGNTGPGFNIISSGFGTPASFPDYSNYNFTPNLLPFIPYAANSSYNPVLGYAPYVGWIGSNIASAPMTNTFSPFNKTNKLSGYYVSDGQNCHVTMEFTNLVTNDPVITQIENYLKNLPISGFPGFSTQVDIVALANQTGIAADELKVNFMIYQNASLVYQNNQVVLKAPCFSGALWTCTGSLLSQCGKIENDKVNPYVVGIKGNWRSKANYVYLTERVQTISSQPNGLNTDTRSDGYYSNFSQLFTANSGSDWTMNPGSGTNKWASTVQSTRYNQFGVEIETMDALGRFSSALYGYKETLPIAVAANARLQEIAYDGFEDYDYYPAVCNREHHFDFYAYKNNLTTSATHSGKYSLQVPPSNTFSQSREVTSSTCNLASMPTCGYLLNCRDFIYPFRPVSVNPAGTATDYVISYWVKEDHTGARPLNYTSNQVTVTQGAGPAFATKNLKKSGMIDGWQRVEYTYTIPNNYSGAVAVNLVNSGFYSAYFDDIRMHPAAASMKSYVYHPVTLKYVAELDANNFATFYEYDEQGNLARVKKETERGVMTVQESKTHYAN